MNRCQIRTKRERVWRECWEFSCPDGSSSFRHPKVRLWPQGSQIATTQNRASLVTHVTKVNSLSSFWWQLWRPVSLKNSQFSYLSPREILILYTIYRYPNTIQFTHFQAFITFGQGESGLERSTQQMLATPRRSRGVKGALWGYRTHCLLRAAAPKGSHWPHSWWSSRSTRAQATLLTRT